MSVERAPMQNREAAMALIWWQEGQLSAALSLPRLGGMIELSPLDHLSLDELNDLVRRNDRDLSMVVLPRGLRSLGAAPRAIGGGRPE